MADDAEAATAYEALHVEQRGGVLFAVLRRPEARNAVDAAMVRELHRVCARAEDVDCTSEEAEERVRVLVLRGAGGTFCAGGDVAEMRGALETKPPANGGDDPLYELNRSFGRLLERLDALPCPVVAAVEGVALGGGLGLACAADLVLATDDALLGMPEVRLGLVPAQIAPFVARRTGPARARALAVAGRTVRGAEARALGLVDESHPDTDALESALGARLGEILLGAPDAVASAKALLRGIERRDPSDALDDGALRFTDAARGPEARAGMAAFLERKLPPWARSGAQAPDEGTEPEGS